MSIASLLSIKVTSPITHMVTSAVRGAFATLLGVWLFHDIVTLCVRPFLFFYLLSAFFRGRAASIATIICGSIYYTWLKHLETSSSPHESGYRAVVREKVEANEDFGREDV